MLVKVLALYTFIQSLNSMVMVWRPLSDLLENRIHYSYIGPYPEWRDVLPGLIVGVVQIAVAIGLWSHSETIAGVIVKDEDSGVPIADVNWQKVGLGLVGMYLLIDSTSRFVMFASLWVGLGEGGRTPSVEIRSFGLESLVRGVLGLWLTLGARGVARGIMNLKNVGRDAESEGP